HNREKIITQAEQLLREELNAPAPIAFTIEDGTATQGTHAILNEIRRATFGGQYAANQLFIIHFQLAHPRIATLDVPINRAGIGAYAGGLLYAMPLDTRISSAIALQPSKQPQFSGDLSGSARLNTDAELLKSANGFLRKSMAVSGLTAKIEPFLQLLPQNDRALFLAHTFPKWIKFGFASLFDTKTFFDIADNIEKNL
ncbi:MAG: hypothetical protein ABI901_15260, partial [Roseiflexaceae bacterium]